MSRLSPTGLAYLTTDELERLYSPDEFESLAKDRITAEAYAYISGYAGKRRGAPNELGGVQAMGIPPPNLKRCEFC